MPPMQNTDTAHDQIKVTASSVRASPVLLTCDSFIHERMSCIINERYQYATGHILAVSIDYYLGRCIDDTNVVTVLERRADGRCRNGKRQPPI